MKVFAKKLGTALSVILLAGLFVVSGALAQTGGSAGGAGNPGAGIGTNNQGSQTNPGTGNFRSGNGMNTEPGNTNPNYQNNPGAGMNTQPGNTNPNSQNNENGSTGGEGSPNNSE